MNLDTRGFRYHMVLDPKKVYTIPEDFKGWRDYLSALKYNQHEGVRSIMFLQSLPGIRESFYDAAQGWYSMTSSEQVWTLALAKRLGFKL